MIHPYIHRLPTLQDEINQDGRWDLQLQLVLAVTISIPRIGPALILLILQAKKPFGGHILCGLWCVLLWSTLLWWRRRCGWTTFFCWPSNFEVVDFCVHGCLLKNNISIFLKMRRKEKVGKTCTYSTRSKLEGYQDENLWQGRDFRQAKEEGGQGSAGCRTGFKAAATRASNGTVYLENLELLLGARKLRNARKNPLSGLWSGLSCANILRCDNKGDAYHLFSNNGQTERGLQDVEGHLE